MSKPTTPHSSTFVNYFFDRGVKFNDISVPGAEYALTTRSWVFGKFSNFFRDDLAKRGLLTWRNGVWCCRQFALHAMDVACECHALTKAAPDNTSLAVARFMFTRRDGEDHAIDVFFERVNDGIEPIWFEPQNQTEPEINPEEFKTGVVQFI